jgi:hypothetical protein
MPPAEPADRAGTFRANPHDRFSRLPITSGTPKPRAWNFSRRPLPRALTASSHELSPGVSAPDKLSRRSAWIVVATTALKWRLALWWCAPCIRIDRSKRRGNRPKVREPARFRAEPARSLDRHHGGPHEAYKTKRSLLAEQPQSKNS